MNEAECTATMAAYANSADWALWALACVGAVLVALELPRAKRRWRWSFARWAKRIRGVLKSTLARYGNAAAAELAGQDKGGPH